MGERPNVPGCVVSGMVLLFLFGLVLLASAVVYWATGRVF